MIGANLSHRILEQMPPLRTHPRIVPLKTSRLLRVALTVLLSCACSLYTFRVAFAATQDPGPSQEPAQKEPDSSGKDSKKVPIIPETKTLEELGFPDAAKKELMKGARAHRKPDPDLFAEKPLEAPKPTPEELRKFNDFRKQVGGLEIKTAEDMSLIDKVVRWQVYSMTQRDWFQPNADGRKNRDAIEALLEGGGVNEKFQGIYKQLLFKYLPDLLSNHLWSRVNGMKLLAKLRDEKVIRLFCQQIQDPNQHEGVKYVAIEGIRSLGQKKLISQVDLESLAVATLLDYMAREDVHTFTRQAVVRALGEMGRPTRVIGRNDADVAVALLKIIRDPNVRRVDRSEAVVALENLQIRSELDYNFQYPAYEIAKFAADVAAAALKDPKIDDLHSHVLLVGTSYALSAEKRPEKKSLAKRAEEHPAKAKGDAAYVQLLGDQVGRLTAAALKAYKVEPSTTATTKSAVSKSEDPLKKAEDVARSLQLGEFAKELDKLNALLASRQPRSMKLTPTTEELGPPPALAGGKESGQVQDAGDGPTTKQDSGPPASTGP